MTNSSNEQAPGNKIKIEYLWPIFIAIFLGYLYAIFFSYPDQYFSPLTVVKNISYADNTDSLYYIAGSGFLPVDSHLYMEQSESFSLFEKLSGNKLELASGQFANIFLFYIAQVARIILPGNPYVVIAFINHIFLFLSLRNYIKIGRHIGVDENKFILFMSLNLLVFFSLYSLNKEIIGIYVVSEILLFYYFPKYIRFFLILVLSLVTRDVYFGFGLIVISARIVKFSPIKFMLFFSAVIIPAAFYVTGGLILGAAYGNIDEAAQYFSQKSAVITTFFFGFIQYPFGYVLSYAAVLIVNVLSPLVNYGYWKDYLRIFDISQFLLQISSILFTVFLWKIVKFNLFKRKLWDGPFKFFLYFTMLTCILPFSQHRYLLPVYPLVVICFLYKPKHTAPQV